MSLLFGIKVQLVLESCPISGVHFSICFLFVQQSDTLYMHKEGFFSGMLNKEEIFFFLHSQTFDIRAGQSRQCLMMIINGWLLWTLISICLTFQFMLSKKELSLAWPVVFPPHGPEKQTQMTTNTDKYIHCHQNNSTYTFLTPWGDRKLTVTTKQPVHPLLISEIETNHLTPRHFLAYHHVIFFPSPPTYLITVLFMLI